jgi:hypothetical protein
LLAEQAAISVDSPLPAKALAEERDVAVRTQDTTASAALALAEDKRHKEDKQRQEEAATNNTGRVSIFIYCMAYSYE